MARIGNFRQEVKFLVSKTMSREARQKLAATMARKLLADAQEKNKAALGSVPSHEQFVDGRKNAPLESVNPDRGTIVFEFQLVRDVLAWIGEQLVLNSPVLTGRYQRSHILLADKKEVLPGEEVPEAEEYVFVSTVPYARKIERGLSDQAPDGVYDVVADMAKRRFGNIANIRFTYSSIVGGEARLDNELWTWAAANASSEGTASKRRAKFDKNIRQPAILIRPK